MNKKEQAAMDDLRRQLAEAKAMRFLGIPEPERAPIPETGYFNGWDFIKYDCGRVEAWWTERRRHGSGHRTDDGSYKNGPTSASQGGVRLYRSRIEALIGLRLVKERECAALLARIDTAIADELVVSAIAKEETGS